MGGLNERGGGRCRSVRSGRAGAIAGCHAKDVPSTAGMHLCRFSEQRAAARVEERMCQRPDCLQESSKWKERKEALEELLKVAKAPRLAEDRYGELVSTLAKVSFCLPACATWMETRGPNAEDE